MRLTIRHLTRYEYNPPTRRAGLRLKLFPSRFNGQAPVNWGVQINGEAVTPMFVGAYGDAEAIWTAEEPLGVIEIVAEGDVDVEDRAGVVSGLVESARPGVFLRSTILTARSPRLEKLAAACARDDRVETLHALSSLVRDDVDYVQHSTGQQTSADDALKLGRGVCQDHAHIFIAAARLLGIPARYVTGYLMAEDTQETHAWAEAHVPELGWVGFDAANRQCPTDSYVRLCVGLDAADAAPLRGRVQATDTETLVVSVDVTAGGQRQQQQQ